MISLSGIVVCVGNSWLNVKNQNWDQIRDCHHQQASSNSLKVIYGVAFAEIWRAKRAILIDNVLSNLTTFSLWLLVILRFEFYNTCRDLTSWFFSIDYLLIRNLDGVSSQAYFMMIRGQIIIFVMQPNPLPSHFFSKIFELLFILQVKWDYIKKFLG